MSISRALLCASFSLRTSSRPRASGGGKIPFLQHRLDERDRHQGTREKTEVKDRELATKLLNQIDKSLLPLYYIGVG